MNRDDVIKMAREAGWGLVHYAVGGGKTETHIWGGPGETAKLLRFYKMVAAQAAAEEREACAEVADDYGHVTHVAQSIAAAIRARGTA